MPLVDRSTVQLLKLKTLPSPELKDFAHSHRISDSGNAGEVSKRILDAQVPEPEIDAFIRSSYAEKKAAERDQIGITHEVIERELMKVDSHIWGMVQGDLDSHIQAHYVRKYYLFDELVSAVESQLYGSTKSYVLCSWYNHWSTVVIEDLIAEHPDVVPTVKKVKDTDLFWQGQPWDLKITNLPKDWFDDGHSLQEAVSNPKEAERYLYELQGAERFGDNNRLFLIIADRQNPSESWKLKRDFPFLTNTINSFFSQPAEFDEIHFVYGKESHVAFAKMLFAIR